LDSLKSLHSRLDRIAATMTPPEEGRPLAVAVLPENFRGPPSDAPYPRVQRAGNAATITYLLEDGAPDSAAIVALLGEAA